MVRYHRLIGRLLFPLIAIAYASYMLWEHLAKGFRPMLLNYALILIVPVFLFGFLTIIREALIYRKEVSEVNEASVTEQDDWQPPAAVFGKLVRPMLVLAIGVAFVFLMPILGWILSFALLLISLLLVMGERKPVPLGFMTIGCLVFVYGLFVLALGLDLPAGILLPL